MGGTIYLSLYLLVREVLAWVKSNFLKLIVQYMLGPLNVVVDQLIHQGQVIGTEWSLCPLVTKRIFQR